MARWDEFAAQEPALAERVRAFFDARVHHMLATVRPDGAPRISGTEVVFALGDLWLGSMWRSPKARDLVADGRYALHCGSADPPEWVGAAKVAGRAEEVPDADTKAAVMAARGGESPTDGPFHLFRLDIAEAIVLALPDPPTHLVATLWRDGRGVTVRKLDA